jgi:HEAT repeat protein
LQKATLQGDTTIGCWLGTKTQMADLISSNKQKQASRRQPSNTENRQVREIVASNPNTPADVLKRLAREGNLATRRAVAENPRTPREVLNLLAIDSDPEVRLAVAENKLVGMEALVLLIKDAHVDVRYGVAENHQMPDEILYALAMDENPYVRCRAIKTLQRLSPAKQLKVQFA